MYQYRRPTIVYRRIIGLPSVGAMVNPVLSASLVIVPFFTSVSATDVTVYMEYLIPSVLARTCHCQMSPSISIRCPVDIAMLMIAADSAWI